MALVTAALPPSVRKGSAFPAEPLLVEAGPPRIVGGITSTDVFEPERHSLSAQKAAEP